MSAHTGSRLNNSATSDSVSPTATARRVPSRIALAAAGLMGAGVLLAGCGGTSVSVNAPSGGVPSFSVGGPNGSIEGGSSLPSNWPSDVPTPTQIPLKQAVALGTTLNATYNGPGDIQAIQADLNSRFLANGFTSQAVLGGGPSGGIAVYKKGTMTVSVTAAVQDGNAVINESVVLSGGNTALPQ